MKTNTENSVVSHGNENSSKATGGCRKKGKHDANLQKNSFLNFQIGLIIALALVYFSLEYSFAVFETEKVTEVGTVYEVIEYHPEIQNHQVEKTVRQKMAKAKVVVNPQEFTIIDNDVVNKPTEFIISQELISKKAIDVGDIEHYTVPEEIILPINAVEEVPIFPGCEKVKKKERFNCFNKKMQKHVKRYFRYPDAAIDLQQQGRVSVLFKIDVNGNVKDLQMRGPAKILENEAKRIISKLPKMIPGKMQNRPVTVSYSIPINFRLR